MASLSSLSSRISLGVLIVFFVLLFFDDYDGVGHIYGKFKGDKQMEIFGILGFTLALIALYRTDRTDQLIKKLKQKGILEENEKL